MDERKLGKAQTFAAAKAGLFKHSARPIDLSELKPKVPLAHTQRHVGLRMG
jgi:hypothetical protein